ncbi:MAG TPA: sigma-54 dependent transcriptional regulator [Myxococcota bacterium]|nr:sigma-54 dependent transcriptional regulator [Myxococcota bacterium]
MPSQAKILVVDDERLIRWTLVQALGELGHEVSEAADGAAALAQVAAEAPDLVILDIRLPGLGGLEVLQALRREHPETSVVMISAHGTLETAVEAMKLGAADYIRKPFQAADVQHTVSRLLTSQRAERERDLVLGREARSYGLESLVGVSDSMQQVRGLIAQLSAAGASTVLVEGESGTGKGLVARLLHYTGPRGRKPFVEVSCTALAEGLVESELFGHERGAFTDAKARKQGLLELADGGTVFLDEIGDMPLAAQAKLLRAMEDRLFKRVGGVRDIRVDVQVVAATHRDLGQAVAEGRFREDLYYRLAVVRIALPPLTAHREDIPLLAEAFIRHYNRELGRSLTGVSPAALSLLGAYRWPGNVRELRNVIERAVLLGTHPELQPEDLPAGIAQPTAHEPHASGLSSLPPSGLSMQEVERGLILRALQAEGGNQTHAARRLGISRDTLRYRMKKFGLGAEAG